MKRFLAFLFLTLVAVLYLNIPFIKEYIDRWAKFSFCDTTIAYSLGSIDEEFKADRTTVLYELRDAANIWNDLYDDKLFIYDPEAELTIDLVFDERQSVVSKINEERNKVESQKERYEQDLRNFENEKTKITHTLDSLNNEIDYWNSQGGAPVGIFEAITKKQKEIQKDIDRINAATDQINNAVDEINDQISKVNSTVNDFNTLLEVKPEEGLFFGGENRIEIYIYDDKKNFIHTAAHELGHALGLEHVDEEGSIMNPTASPGSTLTSSDEALLSSYCTEQDKLELMKNDIKNVLYTVFSDINNVLPLGT